MNAYVLLQMLMVHPMFSNALNVTTACRCDDDAGERAGPNPRAGPPQPRVPEIGGLLPAV